MIKLASFRLLLASCLSLLLVASVVPAQAAEREVYRSSFQGQTIYADLTSYDGCNNLWMNISAVEGRAKDQGRPAQLSTVSGWISQYNYCNGSQVYGSFSAELDDDALQIDKQLQTATLATTAQVCYYWCESVDIQLTLTGTGDTYRDKAHYQSSSSYYKTSYRYDGQTRQATASGTITMSSGTINLQSNYAVIQSLKSASISMYKVS